MRFTLWQLYKLNKSKPIVEVVGVEEKLQWDYCDLEGLPPERIGTHGGKPNMTDMGKLPKGQYDNLPEKFTGTDGKEYKIGDIHCIRPS